MRTDRVKAVAFSGTELVGLAAAETKNPQKTLPTATKQVLWRVTIFYIVNLLIVGLNVPHNSPQLLGSGDAASSAGVSANAMTAPTSDVQNVAWYGRHGVSYEISVLPPADTKTVVEIPSPTVVINLVAV